SPQQLDLHLLCFWTQFRAILFVEFEQVRPSCALFFGRSRNCDHVRLAQRTRTRLRTVLAVADFRFNQAFPWAVLLRIADEKEKETRLWNDEFPFAQLFERQRIF